MTSWPTRYGSSIRGVLATGIETLNSGEKLRGTDFCHGEIVCYPESRRRVLTCQNDVDPGHHHSVWWLIVMYQAVRNDREDFVRHE